MDGAGARIRIDKWLWHARITKSRSLAARLVEASQVRINRQKISKCSHEVAAGDVVTIAIRDTVRVLRVVAPGLRRGPASEARLLFEELETAQPSHVAPQN